MREHENPTDPAGQAGSADPEDPHLRYRLSSAFSMAGAPLILLDLLIIYYLAAPTFACEPSACQPVSWTLAAFALCTAAGIVMEARLNLPGMPPDRAALWGVGALLLLLVPYVVAVWNWQSPLQLLYW